MDTNACRLETEEADGLGARLIVQVRGATRTAYLAIAIAALAALMALPTAASADGTPDISLEKATPSSVLYGEAAEVTLTASNPSGQPRGYNLTFRDVLPPGVSYVGGSADPQPRIYTNQPAPGQTTLVWENLTDLSPNSSFSLSYRVEHDDQLYAVGDTFTNTAQAYLNTDPRQVPDISPNGVVTGDYTGSADASAETAITAIQIRKSEPNEEGEILRGLHNHQTVYTLNVQNNFVNPTDDLVVDDYLPAGLEFLGCPAQGAPWQDNTTTDNPVNPGSTEEYPGSGPINPGNAPGAPNCLAPQRVETVQIDPPGPLPFGVYTHVQWTDFSGIGFDGDFAPGETISFQYVAAIPERENTTAWGAFGNAMPPDPESGLQAANLDNNGGPPTSDEGQLRNGARATGLYRPPDAPAATVFDDTTLSRAAEDISIHKSVDTGTIAQGGVSKWSLLIEVGEYSSVDDVTVTDTVPDGLCPLNGTSPLEPGPDCAGTAAQQPSSPYASATENPDGSWTLVWKAPTTPELASLPSSEQDPGNSTFLIEFFTRARTDYVGHGTPVLSNDSWTNTVDLTGTRAEGNLPVTDESSAGQSAPGPSIAKQVGLRATPVNCATASYADNATGYGPGDVVCWKLRMTFPTALDTGGTEVTDFLPANTEYVAGSMTPTANNTVDIDSFTADGGVLEWTLGDAGIVAPAQVFEVTVQTRILPSTTARTGDIVANLMKVSTTNTAGRSFPLRTQADFEWSAPLLELDKGVYEVHRGGTRVNGPNNPPATNVEVRGGDVVTYAVDVENTGGSDAVRTTIWDNLPTGISCSDVSAIDHGGTCDPAEDRIVWTNQTVPAEGTLALRYRVT
jgi:uncharacterized repeat protein (TIGR01451 family)